MSPAGQGPSHRRRPATDRRLQRSAVGGRDGKRDGHAATAANDVGPDVAVGEQGTILVERLNDDGDGVGRFRGWTAFVPGALPGETVTVQVTAVHRRHLEAVVMDGSVHPRSPLRATPLCGVFSQCGGCQLQHLTYDAQLRQKQAVVVNALRRIGRFAVVHPDGTTNPASDLAPNEGLEPLAIRVRPTLGMAFPWRYRNQIQVPVTWDDATKRLKPGFFAARSHRPIPVSACHLVPEDVERSMNDVPAELSRTLGTGAADIHHLVFRHSRATGEQMLIVCARRDTPALRAACRSLQRDPIVSVALTIQPQPTGPIWGNEVDVLAGKSALTERLGSVEYLVSPRSFFQVNTEQAEVLTQLVRQMAGSALLHSVLDAYCGTGTFSLALAPCAEQVMGIEAVAAAVADARRNAVHNGIGNAQFTAGEVEHVLPRWAEEGRTFDLAVIDPPRKGCRKEVLQALRHARIPRIVYVSCNPSTLARDLRWLVDDGYTVSDVQPVDMFPQTAHVECVVVLNLAVVAK
ncbi:MAG: 23S rRNA (uracil(1939)-C(5))-methyltransferase RlmD [Alicyclobacillus sp.]|nr:23S rRNA (uracil(1939)-C(5))-methyltransferase RlmD [Alicyclobacillus sp.]